MNNPFLLKQQLKENEEELSKYLRDMKIWQDKMKRKDPSALPEKNIEQKKPKISHSNNSNTEKPQKLSSYDYSAWEKFDVEKACEEIDTKCETKEHTNNVKLVEDYIDNELQTKQSNAVYEKNLGNALVQKQKWSEAILRYTRAIEYYDRDPVFYANRALCYLKTKEFKKAISDCFLSLKLDNTYVKAYQRRSAAYTSLNMYTEAKSDLYEVIKLEPNNKEAKLEIEKLNKAESQKSEIKTKFPITKKESKLFSELENSTKTVSPKWPLRMHYKQVFSVQKPPHLRSKKPLLKPKIKDTQVEEQDNGDNMKLLQNTLQEVLSGVKKESKIFPNKSVDPIGKRGSLVSEEVSFDLNIPPPPKTYVQLKQDWASLQSNSKLLFQYLKQIPGKRLPFIVQNSMDNDLFVDILQVLNSEFVSNQCNVLDYLIGISELPRLQMLLMFCSADQLSCLHSLLKYASKSNTPNHIMKQLKRSFGI
ncbi:RNA polymerase II-associated protein 3-like [Adelges cooleyi]|uniref:RNA polymerase II-associated protein 3-like n=1 Tax=Adelges cooleyi TaxID=133065 RepID=UPI00217F9DB8|nr:RNA polymerase II-associated protein 3-like [Adelges cooleyi]